MSTDAPHPTAAEHLARAEKIVKELEHHLDSAIIPRPIGKDRVYLAGTVAQLHIGIARCLAEIKVAETHVELADMLTAFSLDSHDVEDKDHGPDTWPPIQT